MLVDIINFKSKIKPKHSEKRQNKKDVLQTLFALFDGKERVLDASDSKIFPKQINPKQMLQKLPILLHK